MKNQRALIALTIVNLALLLLTLTQQMRPAFAEGPAPMLRGSGLEIVDGKGRVRASITVLPAGKSQAGDAYPETVLLRLITERGRPSVKVSTSEEMSGLTLAGPTNTSDTYVMLQAKGEVSSLKMRNEDGHEQVLKP
ncbi:MAG TPA: hypothetical protein VEW08_09200 [Steroidobacteraceae bacterium]|nr:hypothetical protein [Steroidobacteraceae bacterium]